MAIVPFPELGDGLSDLFKFAENAALDGPLLQRPVEALSDTVGLGFGHEGNARVDAPEFDRLQEIVGGVLRAVIHAQPKPLAGFRASVTELDRQPLSNRLQGRAAITDLDGVDADAARIKMIDG